MTKRTHSIASVAAAAMLWHRLRTRTIIKRRRSGFIVYLEDNGVVVKDAKYWVDQSEVGGTEHYLRHALYPDCGDCQAFVRRIQADALREAANGAFPFNGAGRPDGDPTARAIAKMLNKWADQVEGKA